MSHNANALQSLERSHTVPGTPVPELEPLPVSVRQPVSHVAPAGPAAANANRMGICVGVVADGVFFASLLAIALTVREVHPEIFAYGRYFLDARLGVVETSLLLGSALFGTLTIRLADERSRRRLVTALSATLALAFLFTALSIYESATLADRGLLPGRRFTNTEALWTTPSFRAEHPDAARYAANFRVPIATPKSARQGGAARKLASTGSVVPSAPLVVAGALGERAVYPQVPSEPRNAHLFFGLFEVVGFVHALHVLAGVLVWSWLLFASLRRSSPPPTASAADSASLYWSLVALMRVALYPVFYLSR